MQSSILSGLNSPGYKSRNLYLSKVGEQSLGLKERKLSINMQQSNEGEQKYYDFIRQYD